MYRACIIIVKYFKYLGYDMFKAREELIKWIRKNNLILEFTLNSIIEKVYNHSLAFIDKIEISISRTELDDICERFDKESTRFIAFCILCYVKSKKIKNGIFSISLNGLANWSGVGYSNLYRNILPELINFQYLELVKKGDLKKGLVGTRNRLFQKANTYKLVPLMDDDGEFKILDDRNIKDVFDIIISKYEKPYWCNDKSSNDNIIDLTPSENWLKLNDIKGYEVSDKGRIRSNSRNNTKLKLQKAHNGYYFVRLTIRGQLKKYFIHRLVAKAFLPNPDNKKFVTHIDGDLANNCVENLQWVDKK